jgi:DNA invertase Pin-like site-specific DNA recombinase
LNAQKDACRAYLERTRLSEDPQVFSDEGVSGASGLEKRPGLLQAITNLSRGDILLVAKRDRLGRDPIIIAMIESAVSRKGAKVLSAAGEGTESDGPSSILMRRMIDAFAEYERLIIRERTASAMQAKKARRERVGAIPYGYRLSADGIHLEELEGEQLVIAEVKRLHEAGFNLSAICREIERQGFYTRTGRPFSAEQVKRILAA